MVAFFSKNEQDVEGAEANKDEEYLQHQLTVVACVLVHFSDLFLGCLDIVEGLLSILVNPLD